MEILTDILYSATMLAIKIWRKFMYAVAFVGFKPIKALLEKKLSAAGVGTDVTGPSNMVVHNEWLYHRMVYDGTLGLGEAYMEGWWDCKRLDEFFYKVFMGNIYQEILYPWDRLIHYLSFDAFNLHSVVRSREVADKHYDLGSLIH